MNIKLFAMNLYLKFCKNYIEDLLDHFAMIFLKQPNIKQTQ